MFMPAGTHQITARLSRDSKITICISIKSNAVPKLNRQLKEMQKHYSKPFFATDVEENSVAFWPVKFIWKPRKGIFLKAEVAKPVKKARGLFAAPCFSADADWARIKQSNGSATFLPKARGGENNPAQVTGIAGCVGYLTDAPSFKTIAPIL